MTRGDKGFRGSLLAVIGAAALWALPLAAADLGSDRLDIIGLRLAVSPESQTVPLGTPTVVATELAAGAALSAGLEVVGELRGPEIAGSMTLRTRPGEPFAIPRLHLEGEYRLENIRLLEGGELRAYATPRDVALQVTQVLVTRVSSRPLTLDEVRSYGVVLGDDNFQAFNFTFAFAVDGRIVDYNLPVLYNPINANDPLVVLGTTEPLVGGSTGTTSPRFRPPPMAPFQLRLAEPSGGGGGATTGGCQLAGGCFVEDSVALPGVVLFPAEVSLLHQFFSVVLVAKNDAPEGDPLVIRDLQARVQLPPALRMADTEPPTPLGVPIPVRVPGADGELGTADDLTFLIAQAEGQAEVVVEGRQPGTHLVDFRLDGVLEGLPAGPQRLQGSARGAVIVRDPTLAITIGHPEVVRSDEEYSLLLTVTNTSNAPVNQVTVELPAQGLSGAELVGPGAQTLATILPGEGETAEFRLRARRTGRVVASAVKAASAVDPSFELTAAIGEAGIPLSPDSLVLPRAIEHLPAVVQRHGQALLGLGFSLASAPPDFEPRGRPRLSREELDERAYWLTQAGRHIALGEDPVDSLAVLAAEWTGGRDAHGGWDALRRVTQRGGLMSDAIGQTFAAAAQVTSPRSLAERLAKTTAYLESPIWVLAEGGDARLEIAAAGDGRRLAGSGIDPSRRRELPFGDLWDLPGAQLALLAAPWNAGGDGGWQVRLRGAAERLELYLPAVGGGLRRLSFEALGMTASGLAVVDFTAAGGAVTAFVDAQGDGLVDAQVDAVESALAGRPFSALAAVQNLAADPSAHIVDVLLSQDLDLASLLPVEAARFTIPGKVSNGGLVPIEEDLANFFETVAEDPFEGLRNSRIVRVIFDNPISPYVAQDLTVRDLRSVTGEALQNVSLPVATSAEEPGTQVQGTVFGPDGRPVPFGRVELFEVDYFHHFPTPCRQHKTAAVVADAAGRFTFDYVRQTRCSDIFTLQGADPASGQRGTARGRVRFVGGVQEIDVLMLGRGSVRGHLSYDDGTVPADFRVVAYSPVFTEGREARVFSDGRFEVGEVPVGTVSLSATDRAGSFVYQTLEIPVAGAVVERDLVILRRPHETGTGEVRGRVVASDGASPVWDAYLALYVDGELVGVERSAADGHFDFGLVPSGRGEIEAFDGESGLAGAQLVFDIARDQVLDLTVPLSRQRGTLEGRVTRLGSGGPQPVPGAVVWLGGTPFNTVTDSAGNYRLDGVFAGTRTLFAADVERQEQTSAQVTVQDAITTSRDLVFAGAPAVTGGLAGEVIGFAGSPVPGALVHIATGGDRWWHEAVTDSLGRFRIPDLPPGTYVLHAVTASGSAGAVKSATIRFAGETPFVRLQFKKGVVRGAVRSELAPGVFVGVPSLVTYRTTVVQEGLVGLDWQPRTLETAADGTFELPDVLAGPYQLHVSNPFYGERLVRGEIFFHGEVQEHLVDFAPNGTIRGRVLDWDGETPVGGATVTLGHPAFSLYDLETADDGSFAFELVPPFEGRIALDVDLDRGSLFRRQRVWVGLDRPGTELDVDIVLPAQGSVSGFVEDAGGVPVGGAVVTLSEHAYPGRSLTLNADGDGRFRFTNVFAGTVSLAAQAPALGGLGARTTVALTHEGEEVSTRLELEATGEVVGRVLSPVTGEAAASVQVSLFRWGGGLFDSVTADGDGRFRFRLLPLGQYRLWVFDPATGRHGQSEGAWVEHHGHVRTADVTLEGRGAVDGHLTDPGSGAGVPAATVRADIASLVPFTSYSSTDAAGYFEFLGIPEGGVLLRVREPDGRRRASGSGTVSAEGERITIDLVLEASGRVVGEVRAPAGAAPELADNVNVLIYQDDQVVGASLENPYSFEGLIAGRTFRLEAREVGGNHRGLAWGHLSGEGEEVTVDIDLAARGSAEVTVLDSLGAVVPGADVSLLSSGFYGNDWQSSSSDGGGRATFVDVGAGQLSAWAVDPVTQLAGSATGTLSAEGEVASLSVQLADSGTVVGRILAADGVTAAEALVSLAAAGRHLQTFTGGDGSFRFDAVPLGALEVAAQERFGSGAVVATGSLAANAEVLDLGALVMDAADPAVVELLPASGSSDIPLDAEVTVRFSEAMTTTGYVVSFVDGAGAAVATSAAWSEGDTRLTLTPLAPLNSATGYQVTVWQAWDVSGRALFERARTAFTTVDLVAPTLIDVLPRDGQNQVDPAAPLHLTFSEPIVPASVSGASLVLADLTAGGTVATTWQVLPGERQVRVTAAAGLATDREYALTVTGAEDGSGNVMTTPVTTHFWTLDTTPPEITAVTFPAGSDFVSGDDLPVEVAASDLWGVAEVRLRLDDWVFSDTAEPFVPLAVAPVVGQPAAVTLIVEAQDVHGNVATTSRTVQVEPLVNAAAPEVTPACALDGDVVVPGETLDLALEATDDLALERLRVLVDGVEVGEVSPLRVASGSAAFAWIPPSDATPGTTWSVRLEARDFAGNLGVADLLLSVPAGTVLVGGRSLLPSDGGQDLTLGAGTFLLRDPLTFSNLRLAQGAELVTAAGSADLALAVAGEMRVQCDAVVRHGAGGRLSLDVGGELVVAPRGAVSGDGLGFAGATSDVEAGAAPAWVAAARPDAGGSHGGSGIARNSSGSLGEVYGSVYQPTLAGGGGARHCEGSCTGAGGQAGGGVVSVTAGSLRLEGEISARGGVAASGQTGGAGGSVQVRVGGLSGGGTLDASGGAATACSFPVPQGSGGGGRVALFAESLAGPFDVASQLLATGAPSGPCSSQPQAWSAAGTAFALLPGMTYGHLGIRNGPAGASAGRHGPATELPALGGGAVVAFQASGDDAWITLASPLWPRWLGAWVVLRDAATGELGTFPVADLDSAGGRLLLSGAATAAAAATYEGLYRFDRVELVAAGLEVTDGIESAELVLFDGGRLEGDLGASRLELHGETIELGDDLVVDELIVGAGTRLVPAAGRSALRLHSRGDLTISAGAVLDVDGRGYGAAGAELAPTWVSAASGSSGGSHGGHGTAGKEGAAGEAFDSVYEPHLAGGGAPGSPAAAGGGAIILTAEGTLTFDGIATARGESAVGPTWGAGAGGAVTLRGGSLLGSGTIDASGGDALFCDSFGTVRVSGAGGGGRVALLSEGAGALDPSQVMAHGGRRVSCTSAFPQTYGGPGTVLTRSMGDTYGALRVDSGVAGDGSDRDGLTVELPTLGSATVVATAVEGGDLWVTAAEVLRPRWRGAWMVLTNSAGGDLGAFRVLDLDTVANRARLAGAAGAASASSLRGEYRFDRVELLHGAGLATSDELLVTGLQTFDGAVEVPSTVAAGEVLVTAGSTVTPATGSELRFDVAGALTVEAGAVIDVTARGYAGGDAGQRGETFGGLAGAGYRTGGSHGGIGIGNDGSGDPGEVFDSVYRPHLPGGGGGPRGSTGSSGGGVLAISAGSVHLEGTLRADGGNLADALGAGGSVALEVAGGISGGGLIEARGGFQDYCGITSPAGVGGGGRIALRAATFAGFDPGAQAQAWGGGRSHCGGLPVYGGSGTLFFADGGATYGSLILDNGVDPWGSPRQAPEIALPSLGGGTLAATEAESGDLWVTGDGAFGPRWLGAWMMLRDAAGGDLAAYEVVALDGAGRARLAGAADRAGVATAYRGEYLFDVIDLRHGAVLTPDDPVQGSDLVIEGEVTLVEPLVADSLLVKAGAIVRPAPGTALSIAVSGDMVVEAGAVLDASGEGFAGGTQSSPAGGAPSWVAPSQPDAGGSHGGAGSPWDLAAGPAGETYGSLYRPRLGGGGGALDNDGWGDGQPGGGVVEIVAGSLHLEGSILANGLSGNLDERGGGAGGSVWIETPVLSGGGVIEASGGYARSDASWKEVGAGGGGRVALRVGTLVGFDPDLQVQAYGNGFYGAGWQVYRCAAAGTVYTEIAGQSPGNLRIQSWSGCTGLLVPETVLPALGSGSVAALEVSGNDLWVTAGAALRPRWEGAWMTLLDGIGVPQGSFRVAAVDATGRALLADAAGVGAAVSFFGEYRFGDLAALAGAGLEASDPMSAADVELTGPARLPTPLPLASLTLRSGSVLAPTSGAVVDLDVGGDVVIEAGARIDVAGLGYGGGTTAAPNGLAPAGVSASAVEAGGSHGGSGSPWNLANGPAGEIYDSVTAPRLPGGGGALDDDGHGAGLPGGGVIAIAAAHVQLDGDLWAYGLASNDAGQAGGAGGSVRIVADSLSGSGEIVTAGGWVRSCGAWSEVGAGGGGRIALEVPALGVFDPAVQAKAFGTAFFSCGWSPYRCAGPGTVWSRPGTGVHGDLLVVHEGLCVAPTPVTALPALGSGIVGTVSADGDNPLDLWIEPQDPLQQVSLGVVGMWLRSGGSDFRVIAEAGDRRRFLLEGASGLVDSGDAFEGVYKFDTVTVRGGAILEFRDTAEVDTFDVDWESQVILP